MKVVVFLLLALFLASCSSPYLLNEMGYEVLSEGLDEAWPFVAGHEYFRSTPAVQSPKQFEGAGGGMCGGFANDLIYRLGPDASFVICRMSWSAPGVSHAIVLYRGEYIEPQIYGCKYEAGDGSLVEVVKVYGYYDAMRCATSYGTRALGGVRFDPSPVPGRR